MSLMTGGFEADGLANKQDYLFKRPTERQPVVLDMVHLRTYTLGVVDLEREILALFLAELPKTFANLKGAADKKAWHMAAHTLKGSALAIGAGHLAAAGAVAESAKFSLSDEREAAIAGVFAAIDDVTAEVNRLGFC